MQVLVRDNNVDQALRALKKKMQREGIFREMKMRDFYEKPSQKRAREKAEAVRRVRKLARKRAQREGPFGRPRRPLDLPLFKRNLCVLLGGAMESPPPLFVFLSNGSARQRFIRTGQTRERRVTAHKTPGTGISRLPAILLIAASAFALAACQATNPESVISIDRAQGSEGNIASLTQVIANNPNDAKAYNVRGSAYGRAGDFQKALKDFNTAIQLDPNFYQAYANRALIYRGMGDLSAASNDYNKALQINPRYDVAYIGRGNMYREAGQSKQRVQRLQPRHQSRYHRSAGLQQPRPDLPATQAA